jgi:hypothetical protein
MCGGDEQVLRDWSWKGKVGDGLRIGSFGREEGWCLSGRRSAFILVDEAQIVGHIDSNRVLCR